MPRSYERFRCSPSSFLLARVGAAADGYSGIHSLLFRSVFPTNRLEQLPGGAGIVLDDVMAGLYTLISLRLLLKIGWA